MQSFRAPRATTNPYITMLDEALALDPQVQHLRFEWRTAILGRYDVFHWHWPEGKLEASTWWKTAGKRALFGALLLRHSLTRVAVVRTVHNIELPDVDRLARSLLLRCERTTTYRIVLNESTPVLPDQPHALILHGHYRDWFARHPRSEPRRHQLGFFGGVRRYKSIDDLLRAYREAVQTDTRLSLRIGGRPSSPELAATLRAETADLPGVSLRLEFLEDEDLVEIATSSQLVVLAYRFMHNSGSVLAALSLDRPVLVPRNAVNESLADEVGEGWVLMFDGELDGPRLLEALEHARALPRTSGPDLSRREWTKVGSEHAEAYRAAREHRSGRTS